MKVKLLGCEIVRKKKVICSILILLCLIGIVIGGYQAYKQIQGYLKGSSSYTELYDYITLPEGDGSQAGEQEDNYQIPVIDFDNLQKINSDIIGWIYIEGTNINYPIVQGRDNKYYLKHLFNGEWNSSGCIFLDSRKSSDLLDKHNIIYGHHMRDGKMFSDLMKYKQQSFYEKHPEILILTPDGNYKFIIFSAYVASITDGTWDIDFNTENHYEEWINKSLYKSCLKCDINPTTADQIVTLSTCSYEYNNASFVLLGLLKKFD